MMKKYTEPSIKVLKVDNVDIIQTSLVIGEDFNTGSGSSGTMPSPTNTLNNVNPYKTN